MVEVGLRELRNNLSRFVSVVRNGDEVLIKDRGRPVARLVAAEGMSKVERLIAEGVITPAERPRTPSRRHRPARARESVTDILLAERRR